MAKNKSLLSFQGTLDGFNYVHSKTYGKYVRAVRGTYKEATVNAAFKAASSRLLNANVPAKIIKDAIDPYRTHFKGGQLWQRLVSFFRKQLHEQGAVDFSMLPETEVQEHYPLSRLLTIKADASAVSNGILPVTLSCSGRPQFRNPAGLDGYRIGIIGIFPDITLKSAHTSVVYAPVLKLKNDPGILSLNLSVPVDATDYVLCAVVEGISKAIPNESPATKAMQILKAGKC